MTSLDKFFVAASRLARRPAVPSSAGARVVTGEACPVEHLVQEATVLLPLHPERALEIALSVQRLLPVRTASSVASGGSIAPFAAKFAELSCERLPAAPDRMTRADAQRALVSYVALHDLASSSKATAHAEVPDQLAQSVVVGASLLDAPALAAALAKIGPVSSIPVPADIEIVKALQQRLADPSVLANLNDADFLAALGSIARSREVLPAAVVAAIEAVDYRLLGRENTFPLAVLFELMRLIVELRSRSPAAGAAPADAVLRREWPSLAKVAVEEFACLENVDGRSDAAAAASAVARCGSVAASLSRIAGILLPQGERTSDVAQAFVSIVLQPCAPAFQELARLDFDAFELVSPLISAVMRVCGEQRPWTVLLMHAALEGISSLPAERVGTVRLLRICEDVFVNSEGGVSETSQRSRPPGFPPFFDFALEELLRRLADLNMRQLRRAARLFGQAHLEREDLFGGAAAAMASAVLRLRSEGSDFLEQQENVADVALGLSAFASVYVRAASSGSDGTPTAAASSADLETIAAALEAEGAQCGSLLLQRPVEEARPDAECLALSAFVQVALRVPPSAAVPPETRARLEASGLQLLESLSAAWARVDGAAASTSASRTSMSTLNPSQTHIFVTALRAFCVGQSAPAVPPATRGLLQALLARSLAAPSGDREARLVLAMFTELAADPACPDELRTLLPATAPGAAPVSPHANRLRQHVQATAAKGVPAQPESAPESRPSGASGFFRRFFGMQ